MKKLFLFAVVLATTATLWFSCSEEKAEPQPVNSSQTEELYTTFKFSKEFAIKNADGNAATIQVSTDNEEQLNSFDVNSFKLVTTTQKFATNSTPSSSSNTVIQDDNKIAENWKANKYDVVDITITNKSFKDDVTGVRVEVIREDRNWDWEQF